jgi:hypothetical protein
MKPRKKLEEILTKVYKQGVKNSGYAIDEDTLRVEEATVAIIALFKEMIPDRVEVSSWEFRRNDDGWNVCRETMLDSIKKLSSEA